VIYIGINGYIPQWVLVEAKRSLKNEHAVHQIEKGLERMTQNLAAYNVWPRPQKLLGLLVHNRKKVRTSDVVLSRKYALKYGGLTGRVRLCPYGTDVHDYMIPE